MYTTWKTLLPFSFLACCSADTLLLAMPTFGKDVYASSGCCLNHVVSNFLFAHGVISSVRVFGFVSSCIRSSLRILNAQKCTGGRSVISLSDFTLENLSLRVSCPVGSLSSPHVQHRQHNTSDHLLYECSRVFAIFSFQPVRLLVSHHHFYFAAFF